MCKKIKNNIFVDSRISGIQIYKIVNHQTVILFSGFFL